MTDFFERQNEEDCSVHSLNNALGRVVITPEEVSGEIERRVSAFANTLGDEPDSARVVKYAQGLATDETFFTAESVWYAAVGLGRCGVPRRMEYDFVKGLTPEILAKKHLILLGESVEDSPHAIGVRNGFIYDSLNEEDEPPVPLTDENIKKKYKNVYAIFAF